MNIHINIQTLINVHTRKLQKKKKELKNQLCHSKPKYPLRKQEWNWNVKIREPRETKRINTPRCLAKPSAHSEKLRTFNTGAPKLPRSITDYVNNIFSNDMQAA